MMSDEEIETAIAVIETLLLRDTDRITSDKAMQLIRTLRKERDTYRFLLERETKRCHEFMQGNYAPI